MEEATCRRYVGGGIIKPSVSVLTNSVQHRQYHTRTPWLVLPCILRERGKDPDRAYRRTAFVQRTERRGVGRGRRALS